jgi:hypothetical protein
MNKMHTLAKIILSAIGIFFSIRLLSQLPLAISWFCAKPSLETAGAMSFSLLLTAGLIVVLLYLFFYKSESLAKKIVGSEQLPEPGSQIQWLPVVLRLTCIASGFYFLLTVIWQANYAICQTAFFKAQENAHTTRFPLFNYQSLLPWIVMLICGIYLLCGAPHFVRWQVKKILQQCSKDRAEIT